MLRFPTLAYNKLYTKNYVNHSFDVYKSPKGAVLVNVFRLGRHVMSMYVGLRDGIPKIYYQGIISKSGYNIPLKTVEKINIALQNILDDLKKKEEGESL